jgi:hypothetical protein
MSVSRRDFCTGIIAAGVAVGRAKAETLAASTGWRVEFELLPGTGPLALVLLHGKNGAPRTPLMRNFAERVAAAGISVYLPAMPWSRAWNGTVADANAAVDALVAHAAASGKKVVVGGLSLGATFAMTWRPADPPSAVVGKAFLNPGGLLDLIPQASPFWQRVAPEIERAKKLEAAGQGRVAAPFNGSNAVGEALVAENYDMTPEVYLSFHDPARFPSVKAALPATRLPVFWTSGTRDPTANAKRRTFEMLPRNPASVYSEPEGDHNSAFLPAADPLVAWMRANFAKP